MLKRSLVLSMLLFFIFPTFAYARVALFLNTEVESTSVCYKVQGTWQGQGSLRTMFSDCIYQGTAIITGDKELTLNTAFKKISGPEWCKEKFQIQLAGVCENNIAEFAHPTIHVSGDTSGKTVQLEGTLDLALNTYLEIDLHKKS